MNQDNRIILHTIHTDDGDTEVYWQRAGDDFPADPYNSVLFVGDKLCWKGWTHNEVPVSVVIEGCRVRVAVTEDMDPDEAEDVFDTATIVYDGPNDMTQGTFTGGTRGVLAGRAGTYLSPLHARALLAALVEDSGDIRDAVNQDVDALEDAINVLEAAASTYDETGDTP